MKSELATKALYVHFEGMDLAGKSTATANFIARSSGAWEIRRNALDPNNPIYLLADSLRFEDRYRAETLGNLYVAALMADIEGFRRPAVNTVQDSTILLRSLAYHTVRGTPRVADALLSLAPHHPQFDASYVFTASLQKRMERLEQRRRSHPQEVAADDLLVIRDPSAFMAMEACLVDLATAIFHAVVIDTTDLTPPMVVEAISSTLLFASI